MKNKTTYQGRPLTILEFKKRNGKKISRDALQEICDQLLKDLRDKHEYGIVSVAIKYPERWFSGDVSKLDEDINYFSANDYDEFDNDPEEYDSFRFHFIPLPKPVGGKDRNNDCLINCIKKCVQAFSDKLNGEELKKYLGLDRNDPIPVQLLPKVEEYIYKIIHQQYALFVSGDHEYISSVTTNRQVHLILSNEHYTLNKDSIKKPRRKAHEEKPILMAEFVDGEIVTYNGKIRGIINREQYDDYNKNVISSKYLLVEKNYNSKAKKMTLEESYDAYKLMADIMKVKTYGKFNFYKCGSIKQMALNHFYALTQSVQPEEINNSEALFIESASFQALTYWEPYEGSVYCYDVNSRYPSLMTRNYHNFPIKDGEYKIITTEQINVKEYGIYRCKIEGFSKFFKHNKKNYYTHLDIDVAKEAGFKITMIQDGKPNFLYYSKEKLMNGAFLFKRYVEEMYELKKEGINGAKDLLNILWGALCETNHYKYNATSDTTLDISDAEIKRLSSDSQIHIKCIFYNAKHYKTNYARIKPFILAYGRKMLFFKYRIYEPLVVRIHTDGFYLTEKPNEIATGDKLGELKYEGKKMCQLKV